MIIDQKSFLHFNRHIDIDIFGQKCDDIWLCCQIQAFVKCFFFGYWPYWPAVTQLLRISTFLMMWKREKTAALIADGLLFYKCKIFDSLGNYLGLFDYRSCQQSVKWFMKWLFPVGIDRYG